MRNTICGGVILKSDTQNKCESSTKRITYWGKKIPFVWQITRRISHDRSRRGVSSPTTAVGLIDCGLKRQIAVLDTGPGKGATFYAGL